MLCTGDAYAASFFLKNGMVIENVRAYKKLNGMYRLDIYGGTVDIPAADVLKIVEKEEPKPEVTLPSAEPMTTTAPPVQADTSTQQRQKRIEELNRRISEIDARLAEIKKVEDEDAALKKEYNDVKLRIEVLFQKGRSAALKAGKDVSVWFQFLSPQEREWAQINMLKKTELEGKMKKLSEELEPLLEDKKEALEERQKLEAELEGLR